MTERPYDVHRVEAKWQAAWEDAGCHRAPDAPRGEKFFVHDSTPFPNGPLHLGHVRTYLLGDLTARYQRLRGKCVLYHTGFDSFGLPIELDAIEEGITPRELVRRSKREQTRPFRQMGISDDWSRVADTSDPATFLGEVHGLYGRPSTTAPSRPAPQEHGVSRKATALRTETNPVVSRVGRFIEEYRPNAALEALAGLSGRIDG